ncbi:MAG: hypothetical protein AAF335_04750 [Bacteroidota bacterium]
MPIKKHLHLLTCLLFIHPLLGSKRTFENIQFDMYNQFAGIVATQPKLSLQRNYKKYKGEYQEAQKQLDANYKEVLKWIKRGKYKKDKPRILPNGLVIQTFERDKNDKEKFKYQIKFNILHKVAYFGKDDDATKEKLKELFRLGVHHIEVIHRLLLNEI